MHAWQGDPLLDAQPAAGGASSPSAAPGGTHHTSAPLTSLSSCAARLPQDAREDLAGSEVMVAQLQAQVDALMAAGEMAADAAAQLDEASSALGVSCLLLPECEKAGGG